MTSSFPTAKDVLINPGVGAKQNTTSHRAQHGNANDAIEALQDKVGIDNSTDTTTLDYKTRQLANLSGRNVVLNGDMSAWSLGTGPFTANGVTTADGMLNYTIGPTCSITRESLAATDPFTYAAQIATTTASTVNEYQILYIPIDNVRTLAGETVVLSFYAKATASGKYLSTELTQSFGSGGSANVTGIGVTKHALTTSLARYQCTFTMPTLSGKTIGAGSFVAIGFWTTAGSNLNARTGSLGNQTATISITGVQLERGAVATPFERVNPEIYVIKSRPELPNPFRNASMQLWQGGTSITPVNGGYAADGFITYNRSDIVYSRQYSADTQGSAYCMRIQRPNGNSGTTAVGMHQNVPTVDSVRFAGRPSTFSIRARAGANMSGTLTVALRSGTGIDQMLGAGFTGEATVSSISPTLTTSWQTFAVTATPGANITELAAALTFTWAGTAGAADYIEIKDIRLDDGTVPLSHAPLNSAADLAENGYYIRKQLANPVRNASFAVWQRGLSIAVGAAVVFGPDGWRAFRGSAVAGMTISRQLAADTQGSAYCARMQRDSGNTGVESLYMQQSIPTVDCLRFQGRQVTLSFRARKGANFSAASSLFYLQSYTGTGVDQSLNAGFTGQAALQSTAFVLSTSWQTFSVTATLPANALQIGLQPVWTPVGTAGAADYCEIKDVRIDEGPYAQEHVPLPYAEDLAECRRFFRRDGGAASASIGFGIVTSATTATVQMGTEGPMRAIPTISVVGTIGLLNVNDAGAAPAVTALVGSSITSDSLQWIDITAAGGGMTQGRACRVYTSGAVSVDRSAEI